MYTFPGVEKGQLSCYLPPAYLFNSCMINEGWILLATTESKDSGELDPCVQNMLKEFH